MEASLPKPVLLLPLSLREYDLLDTCQVIGVLGVTLLLKELLESFRVCEEPEI